MASVFQLHHEYNCSIIDAMILADASLSGEVVAAVHLSASFAFKEKERKITSAGCRREDLQLFQVFIFSEIMAFSRSQLSPEAF